MHHLSNRPLLFFLAGIIFLLSACTIYAFSLPTEAGSGSTNAVAGFARTPTMTVLVQAVASKPDVFTDLSMENRQREIPSATPVPPTPTLTPTPTPTLTPTPTPRGLNAEQLKQIHPNELGWIPVLEYHLIESPDEQFSRSPQKFRQDIERLYKNNFYPITFRDLASGTIKVPAGKSPVVLTFDDSSDGQFRYLPDGTLDPNCAWGIMQAFHAQHPDWPAVATFFPLIEVSVKSREIFGQPELAQRKLQEIVGAGGEIGSHTYTHIRLDLADAKQIQWQIAQSSKKLEDLIGNGYKITSLSLPMGVYPKDEALIKHGESQGATYTILAAAEVTGGASKSPFDRNFHQYHIRRMQAMDEVLDYWFKLFAERPDLRFVSDGDTEVITIPQEDVLPQELRGFLNPDLPQGRMVIRYKP